MKEKGKKGMKGIKVEIVMKYMLRSTSSSYFLFVWTIQFSQKGLNSLFKKIFSCVCNFVGGSPSIKKNTEKDIYTVKNQWKIGKEWRGGLIDTFFPKGSKILFFVQTILRIEISSWNFDTRLVVESARVCFFLFFDICILDPTMNTEKDIPMKHTRKIENLLNLTLFTYFLSCISRQTDIN